MAVISTRAPDPNTDIEGYLDQMVNNARTIGSPGYPFDEKGVRERCLSDVRRAYEPLGVSRQLAASSRTAIAARDRQDHKRRPWCCTATPIRLCRSKAEGSCCERSRARSYALCPAWATTFPPQLYDTVVDAIARAAERARAIA